MSLNCVKGVWSGNEPLKYAATSEEWEVWEARAEAALSENELIDAIMCGDLATAEENFKDESVQVTLKEILGVEMEDEKGTTARRLHVKANRKLFLQLRTNLDVLAIRLAVPHQEQRNGVGSGERYSPTTNLSPTQRSTL